MARQGIRKAAGEVLGGGWGCFATGPVAAHFLGWGKGFVAEEWSAAFRFALDYGWGV
jgi:hypothetical protein